jgi:DNA helicase II / ATP-dependent DNA helicase PcrA
VTQMTVPAYLKKLDPDQQQVAMHIDGAVRVVAGAGSGKCLGIDTPVLMLDGSIKMVQDVEEGDLVMGPDSQPRRVRGIARGRAPMYRIQPVKGDAWTCNDVHILTLKQSVNKEVFDIPLNDYIYLKGKHRRSVRDAKLFRVGVEFPAQAVEVEPYMVGMWLGDGSTGACQVTSGDPEVIEYLYTTAPKYDVCATPRAGAGCQTITMANPTNNFKSGSNSLWNGLRKCVLDGEKRIPREYLVNSRENRLELLAGLIDADGHQGGGYYEITTKLDGLKEDILFLARSLGFAAFAKQKRASIKSTGYESMVWRITVQGHIDQVPVKIERKKSPPRLQKKDVLNTGFTPVLLGEGDYFGFELDGDGRFLLGDFTVTHNTTTLTKRVEHMIRMGVPPEQILATTFTVKAAKEMKERVNKNVKDAGLNAKGLVLTNMHSLCVRILKEHGHHVGLPDNFSIMKQGDCEKHVERIIKDIVGRECKLKGRKLVEAISFSRNAMIPLRASFEKKLATFRGQWAALEQVADQFAASKDKMQVVDFDGMLEKVLELLKFHPEVRDALQARWKYVMVDEFQDTNILQVSILKLLCEKHGNIFVVGDDKQSIYRFRAAEIRNILEFERDWADCTTYHLGTNYRSTPEIVQAADAMIRNNSRQLHTEVATPNKNGNKPILYFPRDDYEQDRKVVSDIKYFRDKGVKYEEMMILMRNNRASAFLEIELAANGIPFKKKGGKFWESAHMTLALSWLTLLHNPMDRYAFDRVATTYPGIATKGVEVAIDLLPDEDAFGEFLNGDLKLGKAASWTTLRDDLKAFGDTYYNSESETPLVDTCRFLSEHLVEYTLKKWGEGNNADGEEDSGNGSDRVEHYQVLVRLAENFETIDQMLEEIALQDDTQDEDQGDRVLLSTIHGVKGLESKVVFMIGLNEEVFPGRNAETDEEVQEERRLMYVGMTRAKQVLLMYAPLYQAGGMGKTSGPLTPSRFVNEIPKDLLMVRKN